MPVFYADTSALVKLVRDESGSEALRAFVDGAGLVSNELALAELPRAIRRLAARDPSPELEILLARAEEVLDAVAFGSLDNGLLAIAGALTEPALRTLDAIHVAAALDLQPISAFVTYDKRQAAVARLAGLRTVAPGV